MTKLIFNKKAAMFGLDARIALAIFGALSVITGAALYSAINKTKEIAFISQISEINKSIESFYIDTGRIISETKGGDDSCVDLHSIQEGNNINNWKGPYLPGTVLTITNNCDELSINFPRQSRIIFTKQRNSIWGDIFTPSNRNCLTPKDCYLWIHMTKFDQDFAKKLDEHFDDGISNLGKIRYFDKGTYGIYFYIRGIILNQ